MRGRFLSLIFTLRHCPEKRRDLLKVTRSGHEVEFVKQGQTLWCLLLRHPRRKRGEAKMTPPGEGSPLPEVWEERNADINYEEREHLLSSSQISAGKEKG